MKPILKNVLKKIIGVILIVVGFVALVTPFTPGSWLALIGLELLGFGFLLENRLGRAIRKKFENSKRKVGQILHREQPPSQTKASK
jgi:drug/metabolite transporter (DMT)-like permease